ncbi:MAG: DUF3604 domain-containing protein [Anaerolineales bacterium]|nr:DUF3604 domain-containing protein [Anaerolineales bacterium]
MSPHRAYQPLNAYFGDLHNHCDLSYGHGSLDDALRNARLQLDFASVTVHAVWPDLPTDDPNLDYLVAYHREGFARAKANWVANLDAIDAHNQAGRFVTFPSFEWHSSAYGDYCVYYKQAAGAAIIDAPDLPSLRQVLKQSTTPAIMIPHHIGYKRGSRGLNWQAFSAELSPAVEIFSFHGLSESSEGPYPYLHSMGPRHEQGTAQYGWSQGHIFGVVGSTDHHNAFPGSYGYGRLGVWAQALTRDAIWEAIAKRRIYALTGDRIELAFALNGYLMGDICPPSPERWIEVDVRGGDSIDYVEVLHNNQIIHRANIFPMITARAPFKLHIELGWGERQEPTVWDVDLQVIGGVVRSVEPRFRGYGPTATPTDDDFASSDWQQMDDRHVRFHTRTRQNPSLHTTATEGLALEIDGDIGTQVLATFNGQQVTLALSELMIGSRTFYLGGFVSPAICFHRAVPRAEYTHRFAFLDRSDARERDWYYVRVRQRNDQWAWSSPIWVEKPDG